MTKFVWGSLLLALCGAFVFSQDKKPPAIVTAGADKFDVVWFPIEGRCQCESREPGIFVYDIDGDGSIDIVIVSYDKTSKEKMIFVYFQKGKSGFSKSWDQKIVLPKNAAALTFGNFTGTKAINMAFLAEDGLYYYPLKDGKLITEPKKLLHTEVFLDTPNEDNIPVWFEPTDLDNNGLDDVIIPTLDGYKVYMQTSPGKFGKVSHIKLPSTMFAFKTLTGSSFINIEKGIRQLAVADIRGEGRKDLVTIDKETLFIFYQDKDGTFSSNPQKVTISQLHESPKANRANLWFTRFLDINGDGKADLVITLVSGELGLMESLETTVYIFLGDGTGKFRSLTCKLQIKGLSIEPEFVSISNDGPKDMIVSSLDTAVLKHLVEVALLRTLDIDYYIYLFDNNLENKYPSKPTDTEPFRLNIKDLEHSGIKVIPYIYFRGDYTGRKLKDLAKLDGTVFEVHMNKNIPGELRFTVDPYLRVELSKRPDGLDFVDINGDGITDTILIDPPSPIGIILSK